MDIDQRHNEIPACSKCRTRTKLHSVQIVSTSRGDELMDVFQCDKCGRLFSRASDGQVTHARTRRAPTIATR